jgi:hypothetical protein
MATRASTSCSGYAPTDVEEMGTMTRGFWMSEIWPLLALFLLPQLLVFMTFWLAGLLH